MTSADPNHALAAQRTLSSIASIGAVMWAALFAFGHALPRGDDPVTLALCLAISALVPLGLSVVRAHEAERPFYALLPYLLPPAQIAGVASLLFETGAIAGALASFWMMAAIVLALMGLGRLRSSTRERRAYDVGVAAAWMSLPIGAVWLVMARVGASPLGLSSLLVTLTAVHFHFTSFAAPTLVALAWDRSTSLPMRRVLAVALALILFSVAIVAIGITVSPAAVEGGRTTDADDLLVQLGPQLSRLGAILLTLAFLAHAITVIVHVGPRLRPLPRVLTSLGALAPLAALPLAVLYTFGQMDLDTMIDWHGQLNAYGFAGLSLVGWGIEIHGRRT